MRAHLAATNDPLREQGEHVLHPPLAVHRLVIWIDQDGRVTVQHAPPPPPGVGVAHVLPADVLSAVVVDREMRRRGLDAVTVWAGYLSLGGTAELAELRAALAGTTTLSHQQTYLLVQTLNL